MVTGKNILLQGNEIAPFLFRDVTEGSVRTQKRSNARAIPPAHFCCGARVDRTTRANYCSRGSSMCYIKRMLARGHPVAAAKVCALMPSLTIAVANSLLRQN